MAEKKGVGHAYNIDFLNVVFAASSIFLFISVIWMVWDDFDREWKNTQRRFARARDAGDAGEPRAGRRGRGPEEAGRSSRRSWPRPRRTSPPTRQKVDELQAQLAEVEARLTASRRLTSLRRRPTIRIDTTSRRRAPNRDPSAEAKGQAVAELRTRMNELDLAGARRRRPSARRCRGSRKQFTGEVTDDPEADRRSCTSRRPGSDRRLDVLAPSLVKDYFRERAAPRFHGADDQGAADDPAERRRRRELHAGAEDGPVPDMPPGHRSRRVREISRSLTRRTPISTTTSAAVPRTRSIRWAAPCATRGWGSRSASATPRTCRPTTRQKAEWEEEYHWEEPHMWDYPMLPTPMTEASCAKCHKQEIYVPKAEVLNVAYATYERAGCYACHKTRGFEGPPQARPHPDEDRLQAHRRLGQDLDAESARGEADARGCRASGTTRTRARPEDAVRNEVEINAAAAYLFANASPYELAVANPPRGDAARGEEIVKNVGCLGCHVARREDANRGWSAPHVRPAAAEHRQQDHATRGSYNWVRDPKHYSPATYMPDLRLTDAQVADVATYLSTPEGGGRRCAEGHAGPGGRRRGAARLLPRA